VNAPTPDELMIAAAAAELAGVRTVFAPAMVARVVSRSKLIASATSLPFIRCSAWRIEVCCADRLS